jgi:N-acetylmuramic acid 6-phosphate (MurNAc-6-P) etherase
MTRFSGPVGFTSPEVAAASTRLRGAVAASLAIASLSLCLMVTLTVLSSKLGAGMPIPE